MKKLLVLPVVILFISFIIPVAEPLTKEERKFAVDYFKKTRKQLQKTIKGLSEAQLNFKMNDTSWSVAECVEHIALSEDFLWNWAQGGLQKPASPEKRNEVKVTNEQIIQGVTSRGRKVKTFEPLEPGKFGSTEEAMKAFLTRRNATIKYLQTTNDGLKDHFVDNPALGTVDVYQTLLFLAAHSERHTKQIEEVMAHPDFPKE